MTGGLSPAQLSSTLQSHLSPSRTGFDYAGAQAQLDSGGRDTHEAYQNADGSWNTRDKAGGSASPAGAAAGLAGSGGGLNTVAAAPSAQAAPNMPSSTNEGAMAGLQMAGASMPDTAKFLRSNASNESGGQLAQSGASGAAMDGLQELLRRSRLY